MPDVESEKEVSKFDLLALQRRRLKYKHNLLAFVQAVWPLLEPERQFSMNWHIEELCKVLQDVTEGKITRLIINVPPGTMKSLLVSVIWPCWIWAFNPRARVLTAAYSDKRSLDANIKARNLIRSPWFQDLFCVELVGDQDTKGRFDTSDRGWRIATSVGGEGTGLHPNFIIIDDATTAADAMSEVTRQAVIDWFSQTISSRGVALDAALIVIGQRLHQDDLPGYLMAKGGWHQVIFPMRFEPSCPAADGKPAHTADPRDHRTEPGELLWPELFPEAKVKQLELDLGEYGAAGQLQQRPAPEGGGLFKREWFKFLDVLPRAISRQVRGWDTASTEGGGDYTVGVKIIESEDERLVVADVARDQLGPAGVDALMLMTADQDGLDCAQREEREGGASGKAIIQARVKLLNRFDYAEVQLGQNKITRAKAFRAQCEAGNVYLLRAPWNDEYIKELCNFPTGKHDDQVDASSCAYNSLVMEPKNVVGLVW